MNHAGVPQSYDWNSTPGYRLLHQMFQRQLSAARAQLGKQEKEQVNRWVFTKSRPESSTSLSRLRSFFPSESLPDLSPLSQNYHESPSGLLVPDSLNSFLQANPRLDVRFGDVMSNAWDVHQTPQTWQCANCHGVFPLGHTHICPAFVNFMGSSSSTMLGGWSTSGNWPVYLSMTPGLIEKMAPPPGMICCPRCDLIVDPSVRHVCNPLSLPIEKLTMPVIGFRAWAVQEKYELGVGATYRLKSTGMSTCWEPGVNTALCSGKPVCTQEARRRLNIGTTIPNEMCGCGFYVLANPEQLSSHISFGEQIIVGAVLGWGKVVQHGDEGWRAQYARIVALLDMKYSDTNDRIAHAISQTYEVPIYERKALEMVVKEYGQEVRGESGT